MIISGCGVYDHQMEVVYGHDGIRYWHYSCSHEIECKIRMSHRCGDKGYVILDGASEVNVGAHATTILGTTYVRNDNYTDVMFRCNGEQAPETDHD